MVLAREGSHYRVHTEQGPVRAALSGKMKRGAPKVVVGDRVHLEGGGGGDLFGIVAVEPRTSVLDRRVPQGRGTRPVAANIDQVFVVTSSTQPAPVPSVLDRLLVIAEANELAASVIVNKADLDPGDALVARFILAGYPVLATSTKTRQGLEELRRRLQGRVTVVTGPSGAGKSSLVNAVQPGLSLRVGEVSARNRRGTNTTVSAVMLPLDGGGFLVDTPGFSDVGIWGLDPRELASCFPEMRPFIGRCRFGDCRHVSEPGCAVLAAAAEGVVAADRLESYHLLLQDTEGEPKEWE